MSRTAFALYGLALIALLIQVGCTGPQTLGLAEGLAVEEGPELTASPAKSTGEPSRSSEVVTAERASPGKHEGGQDKDRLPDARDSSRRGSTVSAEGNEEAAKIGPPEMRDSVLTLEQAISMTFLANPDLRSAQERTGIAEAVLANARAQFFPILGSSVGYQVSDNPLRKFTFLLSQGVADPNQLFPQRGVEDIMRTQLHLQQDVYTGGQRKAQVRAAEAEREASEYSLAALHNKLVFQVAEAYYRVFQARELVGVRREAVAQVESQLRAVKSRFAANTVVKSDVLKVEVRLAEVKESLTTAVNAYELARAVLENVMGTRLGARQLPDKLPPAPWSERAQKTEAAVEAATEKSQLEGMVSEAVENRPELNEVSLLVQAAEYRARAARAGKYPTLGVFGDYDVNHGDRSTNNSYFVGVALSLNLFDGARTRSSVRQAEAQAREIMARHQRLVLDIELDVRRAYLLLKDSRERVRLTATALTSAEENLRLVESRFREQSATTTELLDAQVLLSDVRVRSTSAAADVEIARAALERAVGRLTTLLSSFEPTHP